MYSYKERSQAVKLCIRFGKRIQATIRQLGYPTKNSLKQWYREYLEHGYLEPGYVRSKPKYSTEKISTAIDHYADTGGSLPMARLALKGLERKPN
jgi:transposase-like protein